MYFDFWEWELQGIPSKRGTLGSDHFPANRNIANHFPLWGCAFMRISCCLALDFLSSSALLLANLYSKLHLHHSYVLTADLCKVR